MSKHLRLVGPVFVLLVSMLALTGCSDWSNGSTTVIVDNNGKEYHVIGIGNELTMDAGGATVKVSVNDVKSMERLSDNDWNVSLPNGQTLKLTMSAGDKDSSVFGVINYATGKPTSHESNVTISWRSVKRIYKR